MPSLDQLAVKSKLEKLNEIDAFAPLRRGLSRLSEERQHWAGIPMPLEGHRLIIGPTYPHADGLMNIGASEVDAVPAGVTERNIWWSERLRSHIVIWEEDGKIQWGKIPGANHLEQEVSTLGASSAWGIEQEHNALNLLGTLISHHKFKQYLLTGMFLETSSRSRLTYLFRKLRPTVVIDARDETARGTRILCALCLHPIAYYQGSWAGAMTPTDDVIAVLMLMRGDEKMLWRRANQHAPGRPEAGL